MFLYFIVLIAVLLIAIIVYHVIVLSRSREHFTQKLDKTFVSHMYQATGIERCDAIYADIVEKAETRENMSEKALEAMDNYVLGFRVREWTPASLDTQKQLNPAHKYCYFLFDSNNSAIDPILNENTCDMRNPIFQGVDFIDRVFVDSNADTSHTLPYSKCIVDIKPESVNSQTLSTFWSRMGDTQCSQYKNSTTKHTVSLINNISGLSNELRSFKELDPKYKECIAKQNILNNNIAYIKHLYTLSNCAFTGECVNVPRGSQPTKKQEYDKLQSTLTISQKKLTDIDKDTRVLQKLTRQDQRKFNEESMVFHGLSNALIRCSNVDLPEKIRQHVELADELKRLHESTVLVTQQHHNCQDNLTARRSEYEQLIKNIDRTKLQHDSSNNGLITCLSASDYLRSTINTLKDQYQKTATQCNECIATVVMKTAERDALFTDVFSLSNERDDWLKRCTFDQERMLRTSIETIQQLRQDASSYTRQNCGNDMAEATEVNDLIQKKFQALAQLSAPPGCDEARRRECCASRGME